MPTAATAVGKGTVRQARSDACGREVVVWDSYDHQQRRGTRHHGGLCGQAPATRSVREHCIKCEYVQVVRWCAECASANLDELAQQRQAGYVEALLWCLHCEQFGVQLEVSM